MQCEPEQGRRNRNATIMSLLIQQDEQDHEPNPQHQILDANTHALRRFLTVLRNLRPFG